MRLMTALLMSTFLLGSCNAVNDMKGMFEKQELVQKHIQEKYDLETHVGWNMQNGVLTQVTISFDAEQVRDMTVAELETAARDAVKSSFKSKPKVLNVQIACKAKDAR